MSASDEASLFGFLSQGALGISQEHLSAAVKEAESSRRPLKQVLVDLGLVEESVLLRALSSRLDIPFLELAPEDIGEDVISLVPAKVVAHYRIMPVAVDDNVLKVAVDDPFNYELIDELAVVVGRQVEPVLATREAIGKAARRHYGVGAETIERLIAEEGEGLTLERVGAPEADLSEESQARQASVIELVNQILLDGIKERATDIHLEPYEDELRVRYRVDGVLREAGIPPAVRHFRSAIVSRLKIMSNLDIAEKRLPQDGRAQVKLGSDQFDLRISILPVPEGEGVNIRILPRSMVFTDLPLLGLAGEDVDKIERLLAQPHGIILVTGPTGSGKTTTLYACLTKLNKPRTKILTIEDPIEYRIRGVEQMQVAPQMGFTFARALRSMLRHDPDIMLIGEVRDTETAEITIRAALTGHLVFSTLHTNDAAGAVTRLLDMGIEPYLVSSSVVGMVAQRLVRTICPNCKEAYTPEAEVAKGLGIFNGIPEKTDLYRGRGCEYCRLSGYRGRTAIYEILLMTDRVRDLVLQRRPSSDIKRSGREQGMSTLREAGWEKVIAGITTIEEVLRVSQEEELEA